MQCYKLVDGSFQLVPDPTEVGAEVANSVNEAIQKSGYDIHVCTSRTKSDGAEISIFESSTQGRPRYYIDVMGMDQTIASLVAEDFPTLLATLKELHPLIALIGLDQSARIDGALQSEEVVIPGFKP